MSAMQTASRSDHVALALHAPAAELLSAALSVHTDISLAGLALFESCERSRLLAHRLAEYLLHAVPATSPGHSSLLERCLVSGVMRWQQDQQGFLSFANGALAHLGDVAAWHIFARRRNHPIIWDYCASPLRLWMLSHGSSKVRIIPVRSHHAAPMPRVVRMVLAARLLTSDDLTALGTDAMHVLRASSL